MSRIYEKKNSIVMNSTGVQNKEISQGNISLIIPNEQPNTSEANVSVDIKDIRFSQNSVNAPEVTAIVNGSKVVATVPFKEPLNYQFKRIEDEMVFKFAVTSSGDLLGFIYLEIPQKFKSSKNFTLDDWFPVKHLQSEENDKLIKENFVARIVLRYTGQRKLEDSKAPAPKAPKAKMMEDLVKNMKQKINELHNDLAEFDGDGEFRHLKGFEKKVLKKKVNLNSKGQDPKKPVKQAPPENKNMNPQQEVFYRTKQALGDTMEVKVQALNPGQFYDKTINFTKHSKDANPDCNKCENLTKELTFSHKELVNANQRITGLEQGKLVVDNDKLKREMEKLASELNKDRKEINIRLKDSSTLLEQETLKVRKYYETETKKATSSQTEAKSYIQEMSQKLKEIERREAEQAEKEEEMDKIEHKISEKEQKLTEDAHYLNEQSQWIDEQETEIMEMKTRMMIERQRVCEETNHLQFLKGDTELCTKQMATLDTFLSEEKENFRLFVDKKNSEVDKMKEDISKQHEEHDKIVEEFNQEKTKFEARNKDLLESINKHKTELTKFIRDKNEFEEHTKDFTKDKSSIDKNRDDDLLEINKDYEYLELKTKELNEKRQEFEELNKKLTEFELSLQNQNRLQQEQAQKFKIQQQQFFKKINDTNYDMKELKKLTDELGSTITKDEEEQDENTKKEREIQKGRSVVKKTIDNMNDVPVVNEENKEQTSSAIIRRYTKKRTNDGETNVAENKIQIQQDAFKLTEKVFAEAVLKVYQKHNEQKEELIDNLKGSVIKLESKLIDMHKQIKNSKLNFFTSKSPIIEKAKIIANPFADPDLNGSDDKHEEFKNENELNEESAEPPVDRLADLQESVEDVCDAIIQLIGEISGKQSTPKVKERIQYLLETRKVFQVIFSIIKDVNSKTKEFSNTEQYSIQYENFDLQNLKSVLENKLRSIIGFISKVRENSDFFNMNIDSEIISA